jgi:DNA-binding protein
MNYVTAVAMQFTSQVAKEVVIKADIYLEH